MPAGTWVQFSAGDGAFGTACVDLSGMIPPSWKSGEVSAMPGTAAAFGSAATFSFVLGKCNAGSQRQARAVVMSVLMKYSIAEVPRCCRSWRAPDVGAEPCGLLSS